MNTTMIEILKAALIGRHPKSSWTGIILAVAVVVVYFLKFYDPSKGIDETGQNVIGIAMLLAGAGRALRDMNKKTKAASPPRSPPTTGSPGFVIPKHMVWLAFACTMTLMLLSGLGCGTRRVSMEKVNSGFDATDGKVLGIVPVKTVEAVTDRVGLTGFRKFEEQLEDMKKLYQLVPEGTDLFVGLRQASTKQYLQWGDLEIVYRIGEWSSKVEIPVPDSGSRATIRILSPVPPEATSSAAPETPPSPATGGATITTNTIHPLKGPANAGVTQ